MIKPVRAADEKTHVTGALIALAPQHLGKFARIHLLSALIERDHRSGCQPVYQRAGFGGGAIEGARVKLALAERPQTRGTAVMIGALDIGVDERALGTRPDTGNGADLDTQG